MEFYKLAGLGDIGNLMVRIVTGPNRTAAG